MFILCQVMGFFSSFNISRSHSAAPLSPADQNAIEQQQKALLEQSQQQRDMLRNSTPAPTLPTTASAEAGGKCFELFRIRLDNVTVLPRSVQRKLTAIPAEGCMTLDDIQLWVRDVTQDYLSRGFITSRAWAARTGYFRRESGHCRDVKGGWRPLLWMVIRKRL